MDKNEVEALLKTAFPPEPVSAYVSHMELRMALDQAEKSFTERLNTIEAHIMLKIQRSELMQRNWVLSGVIATLLAMGTGYVSLVTKLDRLEQGFPRLEVTLDKQLLWMEQQVIRDDMQDDVLRKLDPEYKPYRIKENR